MSVPFNPPILNSNLVHIKPSATLAINELSQELIDQGKKVYRFGLGQSPFPVPNVLVNELIKSAPIKDYLAVQGLYSLREAISDYLFRTEAVKFGANQIIVGPGSKELMYILQKVMDTDLLLPAPSWVSYEPQSKLCGLNCYWIPCSIEDDWKLKAESLEQYSNEHPSAKLLILNSPNNPSGASYTKEELKAIAEVAKKHQLVVLSDEIYSQLQYEAKHLSLARYYPEGTIISNGISKWSGAGGWRLGFMAFPETLNNVLKGMRVVASETYTSVSAPIQFAAIKAFEDSEEMAQYIQTTRKIMQFVTHTFCKQLQKNNVLCPEPLGGFYVLCKFNNHSESFKKKGIESSQMLCELLLKETGIAGLPGHDFGLEKDDFSIRFALVAFNGGDAINIYNEVGESSLDSGNPVYQDIVEGARKLVEWLNSL